MMPHTFKLITSSLAIGIQAQDIKNKNTITMCKKSYISIGKFDKMKNITLWNLKSSKVV